MNFSQKAGECLKQLIKLYGNENVKNSNSCNKYITFYFYCSLTDLTDLNLTFINKCSNKQFNHVWKKCKKLLLKLSLKCLKTNKTRDRYQILQCGKSIIYYLFILKIMNFFICARQKTIEQIDFNEYFQHL